MHHQSLLKCMNNDDFKACLKDKKQLRYIEAELLVAIMYCVFVKMYIISILF